MYSTAYITILQQEYKIMVQKAVAQLSKTYRPIHTYLYTQDDLGQAWKQYAEF